MDGFRWHSSRRTPFDSRGDPALARWAILATNEAHRSPSSVSSVCLAPVAIRRTIRGLNDAASRDRSSASDKRGRRPAARQSRDTDRPARSGAYAASLRVTNSVKSRTRFVLRVSPCMRSQSVPYMCRPVPGTLRRATAATNFTVAGRQRPAALGVRMRASPHRPRRLLSDLDDDLALVAYKVAKPF